MLCLSLIRYLIFFDDGYAQYVSPEFVFLICESSPKVWNDVDPNSYDFVKEYISKYPDWPLVKLSEGSLISVEWNGKINHSVRNSTNLQQSDL